MTDKMVNPVMAASTVKGKLNATVTTPVKVEQEVQRLVQWHLNHMIKMANDKEAATLINLGKWQILCRVSEIGSLTGHTSTDSTTKGHYCPSGTRFGEWTSEAGMKAKELAINVWGLHKMTAEDFFNFCVHESIHAFSDLTSTSNKDRDCASNGRHNKRFVALVERSGVLDAIKIDTTAAWTTVINDTGRKAMKKLKVSAPKIGKTPARKKKSPKRVTYVCDHCPYQIGVPTGAHERGEINLMCHDHDQWLHARVRV